MGHKPLPESFFGGAATAVAQALLGHILVHETAQGLTAGRIVETEAYDQTDPASHSYRGPTPRTQPMFAKGGLAYVYRSYGIHLCMNVSCGQFGFGAAVLLRALEPMAGIGLMAKRRGFATTAPVKLTALARGPGNLTQAMGIHLQHSGQSLLQGALHLCPGTAVAADHMVATKRIGISVAQDELWRFVARDSPFVSGPKRLNR